MKTIAGILLLCLAAPTSAQVKGWPSERPPRPLAEHPVKFPPYAVRTLANGLQVVAVSHHEQPAVTLRLLVRAGAAEDPDDKPGVAELTASLLDQGTTARSAEQIAEARMRLARVGIEGVRGYLEGGMEGWAQVGMNVATLWQMTAQDLHGRLPALRVLDVRRESEWQAGHIEEADWSPLDRFPVALPDLDRDAALAVHCKSGYRSMIACSLLERAGYRNLINVKGGFDAWQQAQLPFVKETPVQA